MIKIKYLLCLSLIIPVISIAQQPIKKQSSTRINIVEKCKNEPGFKQIDKNKFIIPESCLEKQQVLTTIRVPLSDYSPLDSEIKQCSIDIQKYKFNDKIYDKYFMIKKCVVEKRKNKIDIDYIKKQTKEMLDNYCKKTNYLKYNEYKKCMTDNNLEKTEKPKSKNK